MKSSCLMVAALFAVILFFHAALGAWLWPYIIAVWTGKVVSMFAGAIIGLVPVVGQLTIPVAIVTAICDCFFLV